MSIVMWILKAFETNQMHPAWILPWARVFTVEIHQSPPVFMLHVKVFLPSGRCEKLSLPQSSKVGDLRILAQKSFAQGFLRLVTAQGTVLTDPLESLQAVLQSGDHLSAIVCQTKVSATSAAFAVWCAGGDRIIAWGNAKFGGDSSAVTSELRGVQRVQGTRRFKAVNDFILGGAFTAMLADGSLVTWGNPDSGGDSSAVQHRIRNVQKVLATVGAFAAILADRSVVAWGIQNGVALKSKISSELHKRFTPLLVPSLQFTRTDRS